MAFLITTLYIADSTKPHNMIYLVFAGITVWIIALYNRIKNLEKEVESKSKELREIRENQYNTYTPRNTPLRDNFDEANRNQNNFDETYMVESDIEEDDTGNNGFDQADIIWHNQNKIPSEYLYPKKNLEDKSHILYGKKVVITGKFDSYPLRPELAEYLWNIGVDIDRGVGPNLDYLFCGEEAGQRKIEKCEEAGIEILDENQIKEIIPEFKSKFV